MLHILLKIKFYSLNINLKNQNFHDGANFIEIASFITQLYLNNIVAI